jgi:molecular chaperone HtpG
VLVLLDELDDFIMGDLSEYKGKKFKSAIKGDVKLDKSESQDREKEKEKFGKLIELIREQLKDDVKEVRLSGRLKDSACCLVADEGDMDPQVEKLLKAMGKEVPSTKRIFEINSAHPLVVAMEEIFSKDRESPLLKEYSALLYNQAVLLEGSKPKDPAAFARAITKLMVENALKGK